jgi:hypothetical protein
MPPLHEAAHTGNTDVVRSYVQAKRNLNPRWDEPIHGVEGNYGRLLGLTPLMIAARHGQFEAAKLLVDGGADIYAQANTQVPGVPMTAFDFAVQKGDAGIAEYLWGKADAARLSSRLADQIATACSVSCREGAGTDTHSNLALFLIGVARDDVAGTGVGTAACYSAQPLDLLAFVEKHAARPPRDTLHCMAWQNFSRQRPVAERLAVLTWMLDHGAEVNSLETGWTPLMGAASNQDLDTAKLLVSRGADPNDAGTHLPPIAIAADSCVNITSATAVDPRSAAQLDAQLAMVQYLAPLSDRKVYTSPDVLRKADLLAKCCKSRPQVATQRRICEVFGY